MNLPLPLPRRVFLMTLVAYGAANDNKYHALLLKDTQVFGGSNLNEFLYQFNRFQNVIGMNAAGTALQDRAIAIEGGTYNFGNNVNGSWGFDPITRRLTSIDYRQGAANPFATVQYPSYDANGNLEEESRYDANGLLSEKSHTYSPLDRLASSDLWQLATGNSQQSFVYSPAGNSSSPAMR